MSIAAGLLSLKAGERLSVAQSRAAFADVLSGAADDDSIISLLRALHERGETVDEIVGALEAAWAARVPLPWQAPDAIDTCGTGGDGLQTFNVSTTVALAAAALGISVVKHGNRAMSSKSGSADVLQALGIALEPTPAEAQQLLSSKRFVFLFAPLYHPGFKRVAHIRKGLGHRSIFNLLGPLLNPAGVRRQVVGVYAPEWVEPVARVLLARGATRALVVHGGLPDHGTDELTTWGENVVAQVEDGRVSTRRFAHGAALALHEIQGEDAAKNAELVRAVLAGTAAATASALVALNLAAAIWVSRDDAAPFESHFQHALDFLNSGRAANAWR